MVRIRKREENGTTDINIYTSYNDNAVWNLPVGIFLGVKQDKKIYCNCCHWRLFQEFYMFCVYFSLEQKQ